MPGPTFSLVYATPLLQHQAQLRFNPALFLAGNLLQQLVRCACAVVGCADIVPQDDTWVRRYGDTAIVKCNKTGETFYVTCLDTQWKGELAACSRGSSCQFLVNFRLNK